MFRNFFRICGGWKGEVWGPIFPGALWAKSWNLRIGFLEANSTDSTGGERHQKPYETNDLFHPLPSCPDKSAAGMVRELFQESASIVFFFCWGKSGKIVGESCKDILYAKAWQPISSKFSRPNQVGWSLCKMIHGARIRDFKEHLVDLDFQGTVST